MVLAPASLLGSAVHIDPWDRDHPPLDTSFFHTIHFYGINHANQIFIQGRTKQPIISCVISFSIQVFCGAGPARLGGGLAIPPVSNLQAEPPLP